MPRPDIIINNTIKCATYDQNIKIKIFFIVILIFNKNRIFEFI